MEEEKAAKTIEADFLAFDEEFLMRNLKVCLQKCLLEVPNPNNA